MNFKVTTAALALVFGAGAAQAADDLTLQLKWVTQAQFAGYYVALENGFYSDEDLDVTIKPGGPDIAPTQVIAGGGADVIVEWMPAAMPFIFNGLKICTTLALIGAIVAEFFGSPVRGMGFRISTEVGRLSLDMVWAEIAVAALAGSAFYGLVAAVERGVTFWHPSQRG